MLMEHFILVMEFMVGSFLMVQIMFWLTSIMKFPVSTGMWGREKIVVCDAHSSLQVTNFFPAIGGRDSETTAELLARDPILLTTRDRACYKKRFLALGFTSIRRSCAV